MKPYNYFSQTKVLKHSLATPLTTILMNTELALGCTDGKNVKNNYQYHLNQVLVSAKYLSSILKLSEEPVSLSKISFSPLEALQAVLGIAYKPNKQIKIISHLNID